MEENKKKVSSREAWRLHRRAAKLFYAERPALHAVNWLYAAFKSLSPYVLIYLSAQIIGELTGARDAHRLTVLAVAAVAAASLLPLITAALERWQTVLFDNYFYINQKIYANKLLDMDFPRLDDPKTHDDLAQIGQNENWGGYGLGRVMDVEMELPKAVFGVLGVIVLTVTLFTQRVPESAGAWTVLNHPLFIAGFVLLLALLTALSPLCEYRMAVLTAELAPLARLGNRYGFFSDMALSDRDRASDIRMYNQQDICDSYASSDMPFGANGPFAKLAWGCGGVLMIVSASVSVLFTAAAYLSSAARRSRARSARAALCSMSRRSPPSPGTLRSSSTRAALRAATRRFCRISSPSSIRRTRCIRARSRPRSAPTGNMRSSSATSPSATPARRIGRCAICR